MVTHAAGPVTRPLEHLRPPAPTGTLSAQPALSLIAVHYRQPQLLESMLAGLALEDAKFEVIIVNTSPEVEPAIPAHLPYPVRLLTSKNRGYADAVNRGLEFARGEFIAACNVDLEFRPGSLSNAIDYLRKNPAVGVVAPDLVFPDGTRQYSARRFYTWRVAAWARLPLRSRCKAPSFYRSHLMMDDAVSGPREVDWATGAVLVLRRAAMSRPNRFFDPRYWLYFEDVDLCFDMWNRGWKVVQLPHLKIVHRYSRASRRVLSRAGFHHIMSFIKFAWKYRGLPQRGE